MAILLLREVLEGFPHHLQVDRPLQEHHLLQNDKLDHHLLHELHHLFRYRSENWLIGNGSGFNYKRNDTYTKP
jgi:hypothetical protein